MRTFLNKGMALLMSAALLSTACSDDDDQNTTTPTGPESLTTTLADDARFTILVDALQRTGLDATLDGNGTYTVFAPTNDAFAAALNELQLADLDALESTLGTDGLRNVLLYHVLGSEVAAADVSTGYISTSATNDDGDPLSAHIEAGAAVFLNGTAEVVETDINASNGIAHVINGVMLPLSITELVALNMNYSNLVTALGVADGDLDSVLAAPGTNYTVFAPDNDAFAAVIAATPGVNDLNDLVNALGTDGLATVLLYHVTNGIVLAADLPNLSSNTVTTLAADGNGGFFTFDLDLGANDVQIIDGSADTDDATVVETDIIATNGAIHLIDAVILPE